MPIHHYMTSLLIPSFPLTYYHMKIIRNLFLSVQPACLCYILYISECVWCVFWNVFLEENKGVHKLAARTAIRQSQWLEKNNYTEAGLLRASSTTQPHVNTHRKRANVGNKKNKNKTTTQQNKHIVLTSRDISEHNYQLKSQNCFTACYGFAWHNKATVSCWSRAALFAAFLCFSAMWGSKEATISKWISKQTSNQTNEWMK